ncbi:hypothetical protein J2741_001946 [Methanolinea mesophila]|uniref:hypothetical protein n=1 Tax=Methanolinea mesophila TaxID=547055 RepID=UPI001AE8A03F|nr:hypothetical protein [Methanolinea mesophila]MBP1929399.1 hypothetical protein [Methanolinea mesophila]
MQLPRGTFQGIKRDIGVANLLEELQDMRFTGSAAIEVDRTAVNLVFRKGKVLLAEFGSDQGDAALERIGSLCDRNIDASLSEMTEPQISLAQEFNPGSKLQGGSRPIKAGSGEKETPSRPSQTTKYREPVTKPAADENGPSILPTPSPGPSEVLSLVEAIESGHSREEPEVPAPVPLPPPVPPPPKEWTPNPVPDIEDAENDESIARDLKALDAMDLDGMTEKIRTNCKLMVEKLNLGHLIENQNHE